MGGARLLVLLAVAAALALPVTITMQTYLGGYAFGKTTACLAFKFVISQFVFRFI